jgi:hypothetical protein
VKRDRPPSGADDADRAKFAKLRDYLLRLDDEVTCKTCGKKIEIPSQHSLREIAAASGEPEPAQESKPALPARFTRKSTGWK